MTITTVSIACDVGLPNNTEFSAARLDFTLSGPDYDTVSNDSIPAATVSVTLDAAGAGTASLWPVDRGTRNTFYIVVLHGSRTVNGRVVSEALTLGRIQPQSTGGADLANLLAQSSGGIVVGSTIYATIADAVQAALDAANDAAQSAADAQTWTPAYAAEAVADAEAARDRAQAWAESPTPPDPLDPNSKSSKTWAGVAEDAADRAAAAAAIPFATRAAFVTAVANGLSATDGTVIAAGPMDYRASAGATQLPGLDGWVPHGIVSALHFPVACDGVTDDTDGLSAFFAYIQDRAKFGQITDPDTVESADIVARIPAGRYLALGSVNATRIRGIRWEVIAHGATIHSKAAGKAALDLLGSRWGTIRGLKISGDATDTPRTGFQYGRTTTASYSCDGMTFDGCSTDGEFTLAASYNLASETDCHIAPKYINAHDGASSYVAIWDGNNYHGATSDFVTAALLSGVTAMSNIQHTVIGAEFRKTVSGPTLWLSKANQVKMIGCYGVTKDDAVITLADDGNGFNDCHFDVHCETAGAASCFKLVKQPTSGSGYMNLRQFAFVDHAPFAGAQIFDIDAALSRVQMIDADVRIARLGATPTNGLASNITKLHIFGRVALPSALVGTFRLIGGPLHVDAISTVSGNFPSGRYSIVDQATEAVIYKGDAPFVSTFAATPTYAQLTTSQVVIENTGVKIPSLTTAPTSPGIGFYVDSGANWSGVNATGSPRAVFYTGSAWVAV